MIFALDIGTRTVIGVIAEEIESGIRVLDFEIVEHEERAMLDGQINDVPKVARAVMRVKNVLEERLKTKIEKVSTAVAGRFLKTVVGEAVERIPASKIDGDFVRALEFRALSDAVEKNGQSRDYCVGYSILEYAVDNEKVRNLIGQFGEKATVSVIAAFLPQRMVEALFSVMKETGLSLEYLTLEPMAAMNLVVPQDLRRLNIALIDVGAGTSDIAISRDGTIVAYGMIPMAGDEITEKICDAHLLSFQDGERLKRAIGDGELPKVENILGIPVNTTREELLNIVNPVSDSITDEIAKIILDLNGKVPAAVVIVGGGAKVPGFTKLVAEKLSLPINRVALRGVENIVYAQDITGKMKGSEFVTPVGIAHSARFNISKIFKQVTVNSRTVQLMNLTGREDVLQALMQGGFNVKEILGSPSAGITYELNGEVVVVPGNMPEPHVSINGKHATLRTHVNDGDIIEVSPSDGKPAVIRVKDVVKPVKVFIDGEPVEVFPRVKINSKDVSADEIISDGDSVEFRERVDVEDVIKMLNLRCQVKVNGNIYSLSNFTIVGENGEPIKTVEPEQVLRLKSKNLTIGEFFNRIGIGTLSINVNSKEMRIPLPAQIKINGEEAQLNTLINCGDDIEALFGKLRILDVFKFLKFTPDGFKVLLNGSLSDLREELRNGDKIEAIL